MKMRNSDMVFLYIYNTDSKQQEFFKGRLFGLKNFKNKLHIIMRNYLKKSAFLGLILAVTFALSNAFAFSAYASSSDLGTPRINKISEVTKTTVVLPVMFRDLHKKNVVVFVKITNKESGAVMTQETSVKLGDSGGAKIAIKNLKPKTKYSFKVKIRRESSRHFSDTSDSRTATTL